MGLPSQSFPINIPPAPPAPMFPDNVDPKLFFEGQWIMARSGEGKTSLIQYEIAKLLPKVARGEASVVVMEPKQDLIPDILKLKEFAPGQPLHDRLVYLDVADRDYDIALSLFDIGTEDPAEKRAAMSAASDTFMFMLESVLGIGFTGFQKPVFKFLLQLLFQIPGANLETMHDLLIARDMTDYYEHIQKLAPAARKFFATEFFEKTSS